MKVQPKPEQPALRPESLLRAYQQRTATELYQSDGVMAVLPMGSGKTAATLTAIRDLIVDEHKRHALVVAPKRVTNLVWPDEIKAWEHTCGFAYDVLNGGPESRTMLLGQAAFRDLTVIGVDHLQWLCEQLEPLPEEHPLFDLLVIDEISRLRNPKSKRARALMRIIRRFKSVWGLTGTPRPNGLMDLFKPLQIISREEICWPRSFYTWQRERFYPADFKGYEWKIKPDWEERTVAEAAGWMLTLAPEDMPGLPPVTVIPHYIDLPPEARELYDQMEKKLFAELDDREIVAASAGVATGKCAQMAQGFVYGEGGNTDATTLHTEKRDWLEETVEDLAGDPALIIYEFQEDLRVLQELFGADLPYLGQGVTDAEAARHVEAWNARALPIFALHPASGGHGLNLQHGGNQMIWFGLTWSAEFYDQTIARIIRPGQTRPCFIHLCLARDTVDEAKRMRVIHKLTAQEAFRRYRLQRV